MEEKDKRKNHQRRLKREYESHLSDSRQSGRVVHQTKELAEQRLTDPKGWGGRAGLKN